MLGPRPFKCNLEPGAPKKPFARAPQFTAFKTSNPFQHRFSLVTNLDTEGVTIECFKN